MDITATAAAMQSLKAAIDVAKAMIDLNAGQAVQAKVWELNGHVIQAQQAIFAAYEDRTALAEQIRDLKHEIAEAKDWDTEKQRYELKELAPGVTAYAVKPSMQGPEPTHHLCPNCYQQGHKSLLQGETRQQYSGPERKNCTRCGLTLEYIRRDLPKAPLPQMRKPRQRDRI